MIEYLFKLSFTKKISVSIGASFLVVYLLLAIAASFISWNPTYLLLSEWNGLSRLIYFLLASFSSAVLITVAETTRDYSENWKAWYHEAYAKSDNLNKERSRIEREMRDSIYKEVHHYHRDAIKKEVIDDYIKKIADELEKDPKMMEKIKEEAMKGLVDREFEKIYKKD